MRANRADKEGAFTVDEFKGYRLEAGITQEFAATNTPRQISVSDHVGRTLCGMVRCVLLDSGHPPFLWGEVLMTASYLFNRIPHSVLKKETPHKMLHVKDAGPFAPLIIAAMASVRIKHATKLHTS